MTSSSQRRRRLRSSNRGECPVHGHRHLTLRSSSARQLEKPRGPCSPNRWQALALCGGANYARRRWRCGWLRRWMRAASQARPSFKGRYLRPATMAYGRPSASSLRPVRRVAPPKTSAQNRASKNQSVVGKLNTVRWSAVAFVSHRCLLTGKRRLSNFHIRVEKSATKKCYGSL